MGTSFSSQRFTPASGPKSWRAGIALLALAQSALAAPFAGFGDFEAFPEFHQKAAIYLSRIARYHALPDGNKRTAYDVMREFVDRNGRTFTHPSGGLDETAKMVETIAEDASQEALLVAWMAVRIR